MTAPGIDHVDKVDDETAADEDGAAVLLPRLIEGEPLRCSPPIPASTGGASGTDARPKVAPLIVLYSPTSVVPSGVVAVMLP